MNVERVAESGIEPAAERGTETTTDMVHGTDRITENDAGASDTYASDAEQMTETESDEIDEDLEIVHGEIASSSEELGKGLRPKTVSVKLRDYVLNTVQGSD